VITMLATGSTLIDAERAFARAARRRRLAAFTRRVLHRCAACARLCVYDERAAVGAPRHAFARGIREIPLDAITLTLEPSRADQFDGDWRPAAAARTRWQRVWLAEHRGTVLPPISVVAVGEQFAIRDGHHRVSVARARGALSIDAIVESA
jgi:hypothetical protein